MVNKAKQKGTAAEAAVVSFLRSAGWPYAERLALQGALDRGDVTGTPGVVWEVKSYQQYTWGAWLREAQVERVNAKADFGVVVSKPRLVGNTRIGQWHAGMFTSEWQILQTQAGLVDDDVFRAVMPGSFINRELGSYVSTLSALSDRPYGVVEIRPVGVKDPNLFYMVTTLDQMCQLLNRAGFGGAGRGVA